MKKAAIRKPAKALTPLPAAVQRGLRRPVAPVVDRGAIQRKVGLPVDGLQALLPPRPSCCTVLGAAFF